MYPALAPIANPAIRQPSIRVLLKQKFSLMGALREFVTPLHRATSRDYLSRMNDDKVQCMLKAKEYGFEYWDGNRRYGYGGYAYRPGYWKPVAQKLIETYDLRSGSKVLDNGMTRFMVIGK
jgi:hypothetical protein